MKLHISSRLVRFLFFITLAGCITDPDAPPPTELVYTPAKVSVFFGKSASSKRPVVKSMTNPIYRISSIRMEGVDDTSYPSNDYEQYISISRKGVISTDKQLLTGTYYITIYARNIGGATTFADVFTVIIKPQTDAIRYTSAIKGILKNKCNPCHVASDPDYHLDPQSPWTDYYNTRMHIHHIVERIESKDEMKKMPPPARSSLLITAGEIIKIKQWLKEGLPNK